MRPYFIKDQPQKEAVVSSSSTMHTLNRALDLPHGNGPAVRDVYQTATSYSGSCSPYAVLRNPAPSHGAVDYKYDGQVLMLGPSTHESLHCTSRTPFRTHYHSISISSTLCPLKSPSSSAPPEPKARTSPSTSSSPDGKSTPWCVTLRSRGLWL